MSVGADTSARELEIALPDGRTLHAYDTGGSGAAVVWHHGTPNLGAPPRPLLALAAELGLRFVSFDRPAYGGSSPHPGRTIGSVALDTVALADALGLDTFAVMGHSGGGPHALACAAAHADRVSAAVSIAGLAPIDAAGLDWFDGFGPRGAAELRAAQGGPVARRQFDIEHPDSPIDFTAADWAALEGPWGWLGEVAQAAMAQGVDGLVDDDVAYVTPWGVDLTRITAPVLLVHGDDDRAVPASHSAWLAEHLPGA
ncbi:MAG: alpha/beta hydrolase, partial [Microcella sp.]|nr:alpha/beta hydrolase [Microcella sp.]